MRGPREIHSLGGDRGGQGEIHSLGGDRGGQGEIHSLGGDRGGQGESLGGDREGQWGHTYSIHDPDDCRWRDPLPGMHGTIHPDGPSSRTISCYLK